MGLVTRQITPEVVRSTASALGEDRDHTASALTTSVPSVLTALSDVTESDTGAAHLKKAIDENRRGAREPSTSQAGLASGGAGQAATLISDELGPRSGSLTDAVARTAGIKRDSAGKLLGGVTTMVVATLGRSVGEAGPSSLRTMLHDQRGEWVKRLPGPVASLFNGHTVPTVEREPVREVTHTGPAIRRLEGPPTAGRRWLLPLIIAALALLLIPLVRGFRRSSVPEVQRVPEVTHTAPPAPTPPAATAPAPTPPAATAPAPTPPAATAPPAETAPAPTSPEATAPAPEETAPAPAETAPAPAPAAPEAAAKLPGTQEMAAFLAGTGGTTPQRFAPTPLNFETGSTQLTAESKPTVDELADILRANPSASITVQSFTDDTGTMAGNQTLSTARSEALKAQLVAKGVDASRIDTIGLGQSEPTAPNDTNTGRAENRRAEIVVTSK
jgi:outer membrane protein OmpA-like peptidoglycan-associated protein